jgi:hypothetical protein
MRYSDGITFRQALEPASIDRFEKLLKVLSNRRA